MILFMDGFDHYDDITLKWDVQAFTAPTMLQAPRINLNGTEKSIVMAGGASAAGSYIGKFLTSSPEIVTGFGAKYAGFFTGNENYLWLEQGVKILELEVLSNGGLIVRRYTGTVSTVDIITTATALISSDTWYYLEIKYKPDTTASGAVEVKLNGSSIGTFAGITSYTNSAVDEFRVVTTGLNADHFIDDLYILETANTPNDDFLGDVRVDALYPSGDIKSDFTPSSGGNNFSDTSELVGDKGVTFVESGTLNAEDLYTVNSRYSGSTIHATQQVNLVRKTDANTITNSITYQQAGGSTITLSSKTTPDSYHYHIAPVQNTDPDGGAAWTDTKLSNAKIGTKITGIG